MNAFNAREYFMQRLQQCQTILSTIEKLRVHIGNENDKLNFINSYFTLQKSTFE